jgi:nucleoside 2-deoxyribosyltransferase
MTTRTCPLCGSKAISDNIVGEDADRFDCMTCGKYGVARSAIHAVQSHEEKFVLSGIMRRRTEFGDGLIVLNSCDIQPLVDSVALPMGPIESMDLILLHIHSKTSAGQYIKLSPQDYPIAFARSEEEFMFYVEILRELKYLSLSTREDAYRVELLGWKRLSEIVRSGTSSNQAFVAMWFNPELDNIWENGFKEALKQTGYNPIRIDLVQHNEKICDKIISEIRKSSLLIADFTGNRGGVYFEAGFAMGLGIPVVWTCRQDCIKDLHFDTRQYNHIPWENEDDLREKVVDRIEATLRI